MKQIAVGALLFAISNYLFGISTAKAETIDWTLNNVVFDDGGTIEYGRFTVELGATPSVTNFDIKTTVGLQGEFSFGTIMPGVRYTSANIPAVFSQDVTSKIFMAYPQGVGIAQGDGLVLTFNGLLTTPGTLALLKGPPVSMEYT
jgi:hypothetical protein